MDKQSGISRRELLRGTAAASAGIAAVGLGSLGTNFAFAQGSDKLRVGLVGCGGRGTGAAGDCVMHSENVELVAMADAFEDRLNECKGKLRGELKDKFKVTD